MKIKCAHLLTTPAELREQRSIISVRKACAAAGIEYQQAINEPYHGEVPTKMESSRKEIPTSGSYGCWLAHRDAITQHLTDVDALLICECDCLITVSDEEFAARIQNAIKSCRDENLSVVTFGYQHAGRNLGSVGNGIVSTSQFIESHCYLIPISAKADFQRMFEQPWDSYDIAVTVYFHDRWGLKIGIFEDRPVAVQANGNSMSNGQFRNNEEMYAQVKHQWRTQ